MHVRSEITALNRICTSDLRNTKPFCMHKLNTDGGAQPTTVVVRRAAYLSHEPAMSLALAAALSASSAALARWRSQSLRNGETPTARRCEHNDGRRSLFRWSPLKLWAHMHCNKSIDSRARAPTTGSRPAADAIAAKSHHNARTPKYGLRKSQRAVTMCCRCGGGA